MKSLGVISILLLLSYNVVYASVGGGNINYCTNFVFTQTPNPVVKPFVKSPVVYNVKEKSTALKAKGNEDHQLLWYTVKVGGVSSTIAPTPSTDKAGILNYWVSQQQADGKESNRVPIVVIIKEITKIK